jgi:hypothetical protein
MTIRILGAVAGYFLGHIITNYCGVAEKDQLLMLCTTLLAMAIGKEIETEWLKKGE